MHGFPRAVELSARVDETMTSKWKVLMPLLSIGVAYVSEKNECSIMPLGAVRAGAMLKFGKQENLASNLHVEAIEHA